MKGLLTALLISGTLSAMAQGNSVTSVTASYDNDAVAELYDRMPIGLQLTYQNGQVRKTEGYLGGNYRWNRMKITTSNGTLQNGYLTVNRQQLAQQHYKIELTITLPDTEKPLTATLTLPHLEHIRFNHYADSLKRGIRFYLNVEGTFSSGKIYPLDTASIKFETDKGKLLGQDLLLNSNDKETRFITVTATNRHDAAMSVTSTIPVKQLSDQ